MIKNVSVTSEQTIPWKHGNSVGRLEMPQPLGRTDNLRSYPTDSHHCSDVCGRGSDTCRSIERHSNKLEGLDRVHYCHLLMPTAVESLDEQR